MIPPALAFPVPRVAEPSPALAPTEDLDQRIAEMEERIRRLEQPSQPPTRAASGQRTDRPNPVIEKAAELDRLEERLSGLEHEVGQVEDAAG